MEIQERTDKYNDELAANSLARRKIKEKRDAEVKENNDAQEVPEERTQRKKIPVLSSLWSLELFVFLCR